MHASLSLLLCAATLVAASPYYLPQQRQLFYPVMPQYHPYSAPLALPYRQFLYPQAAANLVSPVPAVRYPATLAAPSKQVVYYPGALPYPYVLAADESSGGWGSWISSSFNNIFGQGASEESSVESGNTGAAPLPESPAVEAAEGGEAAQASEQTNKGGDKEKDEKPAAAEMNKVKGVPQQFAVFGQPQYFGNLGLQRVVNPAMVLPSAQHGAVSSYLFLKNIPGVRFASPVPHVPQAADAMMPQQDAQPGQPDIDFTQFLKSGQPGKAALDYQQFLRDAQEQDRRQKDFDDSSVTVEAAEAAKDAPEDKPTSETEADSDKDSEDEETGTANNE